MNNAMNQIAPTFAELGPEHEAALADYVAEFEREGENRIHGYFARPEWTHAETIKRLQAWSNGEMLSGFVPNSSRFMIFNGRIIGNYNVRHELSPELEQCGGHCGYSVRPTERCKGYGTLILQDAKRFARFLGLTRLLVTCGVENVGSARVIERNGGTLQDIVCNDAPTANLKRYWIEL
ncbi:MAG: GNAT family N-acetyltransferase [Rhodopirellula baltica]